MNCPACDSKRIAEAGQRKTSDGWNRTIIVRTFRCVKCQHVFETTAPEPRDKK